jgi:hypothetical protein
VHAYPPVFAIVARLAGRFGIHRARAVRTMVIGRGAGSRRPGRQALLNAAMLPWAPATIEPPHRAICGHRSSWDACTPAC